MSYDNNNIQTPKVSCEGLQHQVQNENICQQTSDNNLATTTANQIIQEIIQNIFISQDKQTLINKRKEFFKKFCHAPSEMGNYTKSTKRKRKLSNQSLSSNLSSNPKSKSQAEMMEFWSRAGFETKPKFPKI